MSVALSSQEVAHLLLQQQMQFLRRIYPHGALIWSNRWRSVRFGLDGSCHVKSMFAHRCSLVVSGPAGSLDVATTSGHPSDDSDKFKPNQILEWADRLIAAACGNLVIVQHTKRTVTTVDRMGTMRLWSHKHGQFVAVSKPGFVPQLPDGFIAPAGLADSWDSASGTFHFFK